MSDPSAVEALLFAALQKTNAAERDAFLESACAGDADLRRQVEKLLQAHAQAGDFLQKPVIEQLAAAEALPAGRDKPGNLLDRPPADPGQTVDSDPGPAGGPAVGEHTPEPAAVPAPLAGTTDYRPLVEPGAVIAGRYTLLQKVGEGGMGEVWVARQTEPVKRKVALKLIKTGMDSKAVLARFEAERQALALMDHPHIARVLDGGLTPTGQPFFVMELVNGLPLHRFCDEAKLTPRERLELFVPICQAVQHAHQKGIVHRDLKPANILVTIIDGRPVPRVIDFGVAKATAGKLTDDSPSTQFGAVIGTLEYMAPEQAGFAGVDIDTRADIYSLGVILYELLTGLKPLDAGRLRQAGLAEIVRIIQEEEPSRPSTRLSTDESLPSLAALRQTEPKRLMALLRGELDWVVMKCLEKQRDRRYETANGLARDVQRYLADEPVEARPPSARYRLGKFLRRHRGQVFAASLVVFALVAGLAGTAWQAVRAEQARADEASQRATAEANERKANAAADGERRARRDAQEKEKLAVAAAQKERAARLEEERQRKFAEAISRFVRDDFLALTSVEGQDRFGGEGKEALSKDTTLLELLDRAAQKLRARKDLEPLIEAELCWMVGVNYRGAGEVRKGIEFLVRAVKLRTDLLGQDQEATLRAMNSLGLAYLTEGQHDLALPLLKQTLTLQKASLGLGHRETLTTMHNLALAYEAAGELDLALPLSEETLKLTRANLGPDHPDTLVGMACLAHAYLVAGKLDQSLPLYEETARLFQARLGPDHPSTLTCRGNLARAYLAAWKVDLALPLSEETHKLTRAKLGPDHPATLASMNNLATAYLAVGKLDLALPLAEEGHKLITAKLGPDHPGTLSSMNNLGLVYQKAGKLDLALPLFEEAVKLRKARLGLDHFQTLVTMNNLAFTYQGVGKLDLALPLYEEAVKLMKTRLGPDHPETLRTMHNLAGAYKAAGKRELALPLYEETFTLSKAKLGHSHSDTLATMHRLAGMYLEVGKREQGLRLFEETLRFQQTRLGPDHPDTLATLSNLGVAYWQLKQLDKSIPLFEKAVKLREKKNGRDHPETLRALANLGVNYRDAGRLKEAIPLLEEAYRASRKHPTLRWIHAALYETYARANETARAANLLLEELPAVRQAVPKESPQLADLLAQTGLGLLEQRKWAEAEPLLRECLAIREKKEADAWTTFNTQSILGGALLGQKKYADAEPLLLKGYEGMKQREKTIPTLGKVRLPEAAERLVQLYETMGKKDDAARWRTEQGRYTGKLVGPVHEVGAGLELKGQLDATTTALVYQVKLAAGKTYVIDMVSPDQKALDPYLVLSDAAGKKLAEDDDGGGGLNARIVFRAQQDGTYRIRATSFNAGRGAFTLTVREQPKPPKGEKH